MIRVGDIRIVTYGDEHYARHVYVARVCDEHALVALCHPYMEFATEYDQKIYPDDSALRYAICIQSELVMPVYFDMIGDLRLGFVDVDTIPDNPGPPLLGPLDARWDFKVSEGEVARAIASRVLSDVLERNPAA